MMPSGNLTRFARLSIGAAIATIALRVAYLVTDSVGLLADALESLVNLAAVIFWAGVSLYVAGRWEQLKYP